MREYSLAEFKATIDKLAEQYPAARVDFVYPKMHSGKRRSVLTHLTSINVLLDSSSPDKAIIRLFVDHARDSSSDG